MKLTVSETTEMIRPCWLLLLLWVQLHSSFEESCLSCYVWRAIFTLIVMSVCFMYYECIMLWRVPVNIYQAYVVAKITEHVSVLRYWERSSKGHNEQSRNTEFRWLQFPVGCVWSNRESEMCFYQRLTYKIHLFS